MSFQMSQEPIIQDDVQILHIFESYFSVLLSIKLNQMFVSDSLIKLIFLH
jgi:hypothetical protein